MTRRAQKLDDPTLSTLRALMARPTPPRPVLTPSTCVPVAPLPKPVKTSRRLGAVSREIEVKARRAPGNSAEHVRVPYLGPAPKTPGAAQKLRREAMMMCPCRLCALALYPPQTFVEAVQCGTCEPSFDRIEELQSLRRQAAASGLVFDEEIGS